MKRFFILSFFMMIAISTKAEAEALDLSARCACLINSHTGEMVYNHNAYQKHSMASTTKIMTAILAIENCDDEECVLVSANAAGQEGSSIYLRTGESVNVENLVYGMMLNSGNDAACAVAEHIGGTSDRFAQMMTEKARELGAVNTSFKNASGLDDENHYTTPYDLAVITAYALKNDKFRKIVSTKNMQINVGANTCYLKNHNKLLWNYEGCIGVKTGYTKKTGRCLVSAAERDGVEIIAVTLDAPDDWNDHAKLLDYGFEKIENRRIVAEGDCLKQFDFNNQKFAAISAEDVFAAVRKGDSEKTELIIHTIKTPTHDIRQGEKIGYFEVVYNGKVIKRADLLCNQDFFAQNTAENAGFFEKIKKIIKILLLKL